jgi:spermidine dehydrogenase
MSNQENDTRLGMDRAIPRRDFLQGSLVGGAALATGLGAATEGAAPQDVPGYNPPALHGLRGSHPGSFEVAHSLRDGEFWQSAGPLPGDEASYDLVIVGAGLSGLAAAYFYRQQKPGARILILDNHDDFGGHAKRNEHRLGGRLHLMNGGTLEIDSPRPYSEVAGGLIRALGIDPPALQKSCVDEDFYKSRGMGDGLFFQREAFGVDRVVGGIGLRPLADVLRDIPLSAAARADVGRIYLGTGAEMPGLTSAQKKDKLSRMSYRDYMLNVLHADRDAVRMFQQFTHEEWGVGIDAISALDAWGYGYPGFDSLKLDPGSTPRMSFTAGGYADGGSYKFHFPDGNASIARLLVRALVPAAMPGHTATDVVTAAADYSQLDRPGNPVRIRLSSIVVGVRNLGRPAASTGADIAYSRFGKLHQIRAKNCVLACYNMMIPYLCPELPDKQKEALHYLVKTPLVYAAVGISNWRAFKKLGVSKFHAPASYWSKTQLDQVTSIGDYRSVTNEDEPILVWLVSTPCQPGLDERAQNRAGRAELLTTSFETFERSIRDQMGRALGPAGFDPARDITSITVNRWPHGYAYEYNHLFDPVWPPGQAPHELGRAPFGRIFIANSDAGAGAYTDVAIDQGHRAVRELLSA